MKKIIKIFNKMKKGIEKFPIAMIVLFLVTIIDTIFIDSDYFSDMLTYLTTFAFIFISSCLYIETIFQKNSKQRYVSYFIGGVISLVLTYFVHKGSYIEAYPFIRLYICYSVFLLVLFIYNWYKKTKKRFNCYLCKVFINLFKVSIIYLILVVGLSIISSIFSLLILDDYGFDLSIRLQILVFGLYYLPSIIHSFIDTKVDDHPFMKGIIKYVLEPLVIISFIVIYIYILKIIILNEVPSNKIFRILTALFIVGYPIWTAGASYPKENFLDKINDKLPMLFIPFIFLQIYSISTRIYYNGVTEARYLCIIFVIFELIYLILYIFKRKKEENILLVFVILMTFSTIVPVINMSSLSDISQYHYLKMYKRKNTYSKEEKRKIAGAYSYLVEKDRDRLHQFLTEKEINEIKGFKTYNYKCCDRLNRNTYSASVLANDFDISGYRRIRLVKMRSKRYDQLLDENDFQEIEVYFSQDSTLIDRIDLSKEMKLFIKNRDHFKDYVKTHQEVIIDQNRKLVIGSITIRYDLENNGLLSYTISGYLLEK